MSDPVVQALLRQSTQRVAFLFAHPDDSVLSATAALVARRSATLDVIVCGAMPDANTIGSWDALCGFASSTQAFSARLAEHARVCATVGIASAVLPLLDRQYVVEHTPARWQDVLNEAEAVLGTFRPDVLVSHNIYSGHEDHRQTAILAETLASRFRVHLVTVCDRPYFRCKVLRCYGGIPARGSGARRLTLSQTSKLWRTKEMLVSLYASQQSALASAFGRDWNAHPVLGTECFTYAEALRTPKLNCAGFPARRPFHA